ncbi:hypothetical protein WG66_012986, partial [Moniliophthora roreri]
MDEASPSRILKHRACQEVEFIPPHVGGILLCLGQRFFGGAVRHRSLVAIPLRYHLTRLNRLRASEFGIRSYIGGTSTLHVTVMDNTPNSAVTSTS